MAKLKRYKYILVLISIIIITTIISSFVSNVNNENFENGNVANSINNIDYYVITMGQPKRIKNINKQTNKLNDINPGNPIVIEKIDAVNGDDLNLNKLINDGKLAKEVVTETYYNGFNNINRRKYEVGCYLSHIKAYETIKSKINSGKVNKDAYSVIFEDDFDVEDNYFTGLNEATDYLTKNKVDFDILFLGFRNPNNELLGSNVYIPKCEKNIYECNHTHAYLIPNNKVDKLIDNLKFIDTPIDVKIIKLLLSNDLFVYRVMPNIVNQYSQTNGDSIILGY